MDALSPPVFVLSDDVVSFDSVEAMLRYIEPADVDESMRVFDARGQGVVVRAVGASRWRSGHLEMVGITSTEESAQQFAGLLREFALRLRRHLGTRWTSDLDIAEAALPALIEAVHPWTRTK